MLHEEANTVAVLAGVGVLESRQVGGVNGVDNLGNEGFFCSLTEFIGEVCITLNILGGFNLQASALFWRSKGTRVVRDYKWGSGKLGVTGCQ